MTDTQPLPVTTKELKEIAASKELQEIWAAEDATDMLETLNGIYLCKFDFVNESPGYCGDLFLIQSGCLSGEIPVVRMLRGKDGRLSVLQAEYK